MILAAALTGCAPALREPPSVAALATKPAAGEAPAVDPAAALREADERWAQRPDVRAVEAAETLYLNAAQADEKDVSGLIGATRAKTWLIDRLPAGKARADKAVSAVQAAQWCVRRSPDLPACHYWLGVAVGLQAREVRSTAEDGLRKMVAELARAIEGDPAYEDAGPHRVMAMLLLRAPGWPAGPGDPEKGLEEARKAVELRPQFPPNQAALGEALAANGKRDQAREAYEKAKALALGGNESALPDAAAWIADADDGLKKLSR